MSQSILLSNEQDTLQEQIDKHRKDIRTDSYEMSIGEWISLYENGEIDIHPEFQRYFRWTAYQKSTLVESILLGIPVPEIFVSQRNDGVWDVVDGLQRLSTIYELVGILKDENQQIRDPFLLEKTKYLPSLEGKAWKSDSPANELTQAQKLLVRRTKLGVNIILRESDENTKYELFQRLNTGGSQLTDQEVRNVIMVRQNKPLYDLMNQLADEEDFKATVTLTDKSLEEQYDKELVLRYLALRKIDESTLKKVTDINEFLNDSVQNNTYDLKLEKDIFQLVFQKLAESLGTNAFRRYNSTRNTFTGGFLVSAFEVIAIGLGYYAEAGDQNLYANLEEKVKHVWEPNGIPNASRAGMQTAPRLKNTIPLGRNIFRV